MRLVALAHRWLGIVGCLLFIAWFASGIVMMYARMPELGTRERRDREPPLTLAKAAISAADAAARHRLSPDQVVMAMLLGRPAYRLNERGRSTVVFADSGERFDGFTREAALAEARRLAPDASLRYDARITEPDQWTLETRALLPMHRIALADDSGAVLYLSDVNGQLVLRTTASERRVAYAGAVLHWLYFTPFRKHAPLWNQTIVGLSLGGSVMCLLGLVWGVYTGVRSPYRGWMKWHHYAGLVFGVVSFTWVFSGLLSMDPWGWHPATTPSGAQRDAFSGGSLRLAAFTLERLRHVLEVTPAKELELSQFRGEPRLIVDDRAAAAIDRDLLLTSARAAMPDVPLTSADWLDAYDSYYYAREPNGRLPLPVLRVRFGDAQQTWLYIDPDRGTILRKEERLTRVNRWLYHGLHSLDFPWLYHRRPLWDLVVIGLSLGGMASAVTSLRPAWIRLRRHAQRLYT